MNNKVPLKIRNVSLKESPKEDVHNVRHNQNRYTQTSQNVVLFWKKTLWAYICLLSYNCMPDIYISTLYVLFNGYRQFSHSLILLFSLFLNILISFLLAPFVIFPVAKSVANVQMTFNGKRYLVSTFLYFLIVFIGTLLLIIPGIYLFILFCFVPLVALIEDMEDKQNAFKVSAYLIKICKKIF